jgi:predicted protein tyrosine phosphatase
MAKERLRLLFVCSRNQWRSPTAERIWRNSPRFDVRSRGTASSARRGVTVDDVVWADHIFVMEHKHARVLRQHYRDELAGAELHVLDIPDVYEFMDPELIDLLDGAVGRILG